MLTAETLLAGPRGRRMLLEYARASDELVGSADHTDTLHATIFHAAHSGVHSGVGATSSGAGVTFSHVADRIRSTPLAPVTASLLRSCLERSVDAAMYWEEPDDEDRMAATPVVVDALRGVAAHLVAHLAADAPAMPWWTDDAAGDAEQWAVAFDTSQLDEPVASPLPALLADRDALLSQEERARRDRSSDPTAPYTGAWWSTPSWDAMRTTGVLPGGSPAGLSFIEDSHGWTTARTRRVSVPEDARVYDVDSAAAWAQLCRRYPIDVTAQKRHDWYRATGRDGTWVIPDWAGVADDFDAVHLSLAAYLSAAGTAVEVTDDSASVIAAWAPDLTVWFTDALRFVGPAVEWTLPGADLADGWVRTDSQP